MGRAFKRGDRWYLDTVSRGKRVRRAAGPTREHAPKALEPGTLS